MKNKKIANNKSQCQNIKCGAITRTCSLRKSIHGHKFLCFKCYERENAKWRKGEIVDYLPGKKKNVLIMAKNSNEVGFLEEMDNYILPLEGLLK